MRFSMYLTRIMYKNETISNKVSMTIFNFKVEYLNRLVKLKQINALNRCGAPVFGIDNIFGIQIAGVNPAFALDLERVRFGALNNFAVNVKLNQPIYLVDGSGDDLLFGCFSGDMVNAGNCIPNLNGLDCLFAKCGQNRCSCNKAERRVHCAADTAHHHAGKEPVLSTLYRAFGGTLAHASERSFQRSGFFVALNRTLYGSGCSSGQCARYSTDHGTLGSTDKCGSHCAECCACGTTCCCGCRCYDSRNHCHRNDYCRRNGKLFPEGHIAFIVSACYGVIVAVCEEVQTVNVVLGIFQHIGRVCVDESAGFGIVVTAVQVIESGFYVVVVATVTNRVKVTNVIGSVIIDRKNLAPCIICIACYLQSGGCVDFGNVTLKVLAEVVIGSVVVESDDSAAAVVIGECPCAVAFAQNLVAVEPIIRRGNN